MMNRDFLTRHIITHVDHTRFFQDATEDEKAQFAKELSDHVFNDVECIEQGTAQLAEHKRRRLQGG